MYVGLWKWSVHGIQQGDQTQVHSPRDAEGRKLKRKGRFLPGIG